MSAMMDEEIKRWTARRKSALVLEIIRGKTTVAEASRPLPSNAIVLNNGGSWPNLAAKPTLRTALCRFTVDPKQPLAAMIQERYATASREASGAGVAT